uniref:Uncharacterized protein n=1 Tax=Trichobilharzia regenti TaxID=157069 RepID=A0AA85IXE4_TRIRE|nr:unnamed protein product [Trichobilharzia regenti]
MTMITTICTATITTLQRLYDIFYVPFVFIILGILSVILFTNMEEIQGRFPANYAFMALCKTSSILSGLTVIAAISIVRQTKNFVNSQDS